VGCTGGIFMTATSIPVFHPGVSSPPSSTLFLLPLTTSVAPPVHNTHRGRGRPRNARYTCPSCGRETRLIKRTHCCQFCYEPRTPVRSSSSAIRAGYIDLLKLVPWTHAGCGTFPDSWNMIATSEHRKQQVASYQHRFFSRLQRWQPDVDFFCVVETGADGLMHLHWVARAPQIPLTVMRDLWTLKYQGISQVGAWSPGASIYVTKDLGASGLCFIGGSWRKLAM
jgi:hypothetical protein